MKGNDIYLVTVFLYGEVEIMTMAYEHDDEAYRYARKMIKRVCRKEDISEESGYVYATIIKQKVR